MGDACWLAPRTMAACASWRAAIRASGVLGMGAVVAVEDEVDAGTLALVAAATGRMACGVLRIAEAMQSFM